MAYNLPLSSQYKSKSDKIRKQWKVEEIIDDIQDYQQKWNQYALRMPENRLPRKSQQYQPQGKRNLGRPYLRWKDQFIQLQNGN